MKQTMEGLGGGFDHPSDNWHMLEIAEDVGYVEDRDTKEATTRLSVKFTVVEDDSENGAAFWQRFDLSKGGGQRAFASLLNCTKMAAQIEKKYKLEGAENLSEKEWGAKYLDITVDDDKQRELANKIVNAFIAKGPGKTFFGLTKVKKGTYKVKDKDGKETGEEKESININVPKSRRNDDNDIKKEIKDRLQGKTGEQKPAPAAAAPAADATDDEDWPD